MLKIDSTEIIGRARPALRLSAHRHDNQDLFAEVENMVGISVSDLAKQFDSLGENCEFGFVQRYCGAEPLSLMRFAGILVRDIVPAINAGFAGLADEDNLVAFGDGQAIKHLKYTFAYHTFIRVEPEGIPELVHKQSKRLSFLGQKLLEDIANGDKIFVVLGRLSILAEDDVVPLLDALRKRGPAWLMYVVPGEPAGTVEIVRPGLMRATIDRLAPTTNVADVSLPGWLAVLVNAYLLVRDDV